MKQKRNKRTLLWALYFLVVVIGFVFFIEYQYQNVKQELFIYSSAKNWSHRGFAQIENKENTLYAIDLAFQNDYKGVEIDLWFKNGQFYLSHDESYEDTLPKLKDVFNIFPDAYFWLDLKNLSYSNYKEIANQLNQLNKNKKTYLIESKNALPLGLIYQMEFPTSYWVTNGNPIRQFIQKCWIVYFKYNGVSMSAKLYKEENIRNQYRHLNIHLWDKHPSSELYHREEVKIILDDNEK